MKRSFIQRHSSLSLMACVMGALALPACFSGSDDFGAEYGANQVFISAVAPPAVSGGTLLVSKDGASAVAADPDRDRIFVVDLVDRSVRGEIELEAGDEPGRVAEDASGRAFVALRGKGSVATVEIATGKLVETRQVCAAPRGIAYDEKADALHVACAGGELVTLPAKGGEPTKVVRLDHDLRDVVVDGDKLLVSRFKSAELLVVNKDGAVTDRKTLPGFVPTIFPEQRFEPNIAWRTIGAPGGGALMVHQRAVSTTVSLQIPNAYYSSQGCDSSIVHSAVSSIRSPSGEASATETKASEAIPNLALPVDIAVSADGAQAAIVGAGSNVIVPYNLQSIEAEAGSQNCAPSASPQEIIGQPVAIAALPSGGFLVQSREPAMLVVLGEKTGITMSTKSRRDTAHETFHTPPNSFSGIACASCHPEGGEDGHVWNFDTVGARRTQNIAVPGGISKTAPFHWSGDLNTMDSLMGEVFSNRMGGEAIGPRRMRAFTNWVDTLRQPAASPPADVAAVERGEVLFNDAKVACSTCHAGERLTDNKTVDVGTGEKLQVPSLSRIGLRAPFMHDGCAKTLRDRFGGSCGGGDKHGVTSHLSEAQIDDLVAFLESL